MAKTRKGRLKQVEKWLRENYPTAMPVTVQLRDIRRKERAWADCDQVGRRIVIRIHKNLTWNHAVDALLHEWGHAVVWRSQDPLPHGPEFSAAYGKIYCDYFDRGGYLESRKF